MGQNYSQNENQFDIVMAKFLVESCLEEDSLYYKFLEPIKKLDDYHFEELFKGNCDIKYNIEKPDEFSKLVYKFVDYKKILFHYHKVQSSHQNIINLWKANICIFELYDLSEDERKKKLKKSGIDYKFIYELNNFLSTTIEAKTDNIFDFITTELSNLYSIIAFSMNEEKNLLKNPEKDNSKGSFASNLDNVVNSLVLGGLPVIKNFLVTNCNIDPISKNEIANDSFLTRFIKKLFEKSSSNSKLHNSLLELTKNCKHSEIISKYLTKVRDFYYSPLVSLCHLALSLLNLIRSITAFSNCQEEFKQDKKIFSRKLSQIYSDFLRHKEELNILDLNQIENSIETVRKIHEKILNDKYRLKMFIADVENKINNSKRKKIKRGVTLAINCIGFLSSVVGAFFTGGATMGIYIGAMCLNGAAITIDSITISTINKNISEYKKFIQEGMEIEKEIQSLLDEMEKKFNLNKNEN